MTKEYWLRKAHRYLGLFIGIQLLLWAISGLYFTWNDIDTVRGEHLSTGTVPSITAGPGELADPGAVLQDLHGRFDDAVIVGLELRMLLDEPVYEIRYRRGGDVRYQLVNGRNGRFLPLLDEPSAIRIARSDLSREMDVTSVTLLKSASPHAEFRGRDLPVYRVSMDHPSGLNVYVSAQRGLVTARRTDTWRAFDFLWMLHTMDFQTRDDFNHTLVQLFSLLGVITVLSGFLLWGVTSPLLRRNKVSKVSAGL